MQISKPKITRDAHGTPAVWAENVAQAYWGIGWVHARYRPLQALVLGVAARGQLAARLVPRAQLVQIDAMVHRLDIPARAAAEEKRLDPTAAQWLDAFLAGFAAGLRAAGTPWELRLLAAKVPPLDRQAILGGLMLSAFLGLAEGQERMERALIDCVQAGASAMALQDMFTPFLEGWDPSLLQQVDNHVSLGFASHGGAARVAGGSNAWALAGDRTASGRPILCGDPHLQINQMPALFFEVRVQVGSDCWLGASIPGLPGIAVGRNNTLAWTGTFACADNVDMTVETVRDGRLQRGSGDAQDPQVRDVQVGRRGRKPLHQRFWDSDHGVLQNATAHEGVTVAVQWAALEGAAEALGAYLKLPTARTVEEASVVLEKAHTLSLHWVLADRQGTVQYQQAGRIPRRTGKWSGLYPVASGDARHWDGVYTGATMPRCGPENGMVVSANEARLAPDGGVLATLAQPPYRLKRIRQLLSARRDHDVQSMQAIQQDVVSLQGLALQPWFLEVLPEGPVKHALSRWDARCAVDSVGAHAFSLAYNASVAGLAPLLGGAWWHRMLAKSEISVWWCRGIDRLLQSQEIWQGSLGKGMREALRPCAHAEVRPWGEVHRLFMGHMVLGDLPNLFGLSRGPFPLQGSVATVSQGNLVPSDAGPVAVGPAFRMVCDMAEAGLHTSLPGGIDGSCWSDSYDCWLADWRSGRYHRLLPPQADETVVG